MSDNKTKSILENHAVNISKLAEQGEIDPVIGRNKEIYKACQTLSRRKKNNVIIVGEAGVGKTTLVEGIALKIANKEVSYFLQDKKIFMLDINSMVAGTKYRGEFEGKMKALIDELKENKNYIIFIDEIHTSLGAGSSSG